jgi:hypothetical protein
MTDSQAFADAVRGYDKFDAVSIRQQSTAVEIQFGQQAKDGLKNQIEGVAAKYSMSVEKSDNGVVWLIS